MQVFCAKPEPDLLPWRRGEASLLREEAPRNLDRTREIGSSLSQRRWLCVFTYQPDSAVFWKESVGNENSYLFVTVRHLTGAVLNSIENSMEKGHVNEWFSVNIAFLFFLAKKSSV